jgi:hypothetical protein
MSVSPIHVTGDTFLKFIGLFPLEAVLLVRQVDTARTALSLVRH